MDVKARPDLSVWLLLLHRVCPVRFSGYNIKARHALSLPANLPFRRYEKTHMGGTVAFLCAFGIAFIAALTTACRPISYIWNKWDVEHEWRCVDIALIAWMNAAISIALSLWLIVISLRKVRSLEMKRHKKVGVAIMFILSTF